MNIPDKAVEAVALAIGGYDTAPGDNRQEHMEAAREALEAAAPFIAAQALRDEAAATQEEWDEQWDEMDADYAPAAVVTIDDLRRRADELDSQ